MATTHFDPRIDNPPGTHTFIGSFQPVAIYQEPSGAVPGELSNMVVDPKLPFEIRLEWQLDGNLFTVNGVLGLVADPWWIFVYAEKMGPGNDLEIFRRTWDEGNTNPVAALPAVYKPSNDFITIPPHTLPEHFENGESGMYRLCTVVWAGTNQPGGQDIVGCYEGPMILVEGPE